MTIYSYAAKVIDSTITGSGYFGVASNSIQLIRSHASDCGIFGMNGKSILLHESPVTGNGTSPACATRGQLCGGVYATHKPHLRDGSTCGTSTGNKRAPTWGVCSSD